MSAMRMMHTGLHVFGGGQVTCSQAPLQMCWRPDTESQQQQALRQGAGGYVSNNAGGMQPQGHLWAWARGGGMMCERQDSAWSSTGCVAGRGRSTNVQKMICAGAQHSVGHSAPQQACCWSAASCPLPALPLTQLPFAAAGLWRAAHSPS
jgi:hypothetical protein